MAAQCLVTDSTCALHSKAHLQGGEAVQLRGAGIDNVQACEQGLQRPCPSDLALQRQLQAGKCGVHLCRTSIRLDLYVQQQQQDLLTVAQKLWHMPSLPAREHSHQITAT